MTSEETMKRASNSTVRHASCVSGGDSFKRLSLAVQALDQLINRAQQLSELPDQTHPSLTKDGNIEKSVPPSLPGPSHLGNTVPNLDS